MARKYRGVGKVNNRWRAIIQLNGRHIHVGYFDTEDEAMLARKEVMSTMGRIDCVGDLDGEEWRVSPLLGEPIYVSNKGRIKTKDYDRMGFESLYKLAKAWHNRYYRVSIGQKIYMVHRLVADAFIGQSELEVNHKDNDSFNNCVENLEYVTHRENISHGFGGACGVTWNGKRWMAAMKINGHSVTLGYSKDKRVAHQLYLDALTDAGIVNKYTLFK
jgi:hypothetical protein